MINTTRVYKNSKEYVDKLLSIEEANSNCLFSALSFLSSLYFPDNTIRKFYNKIDNSKLSIADVLLERKRKRNKNIINLERKEIYEITAFTGIIEQGIVHGQDTSFRISPIEIVSTLREITQQLETCPNFEIAITREIMPFVYLLSPPKTVLIDVRSNYEYQQIQGILIEDSSPFETFYSEFQRIWASENTINSKDYIMQLIKDNILEWECGRSINLDKWPKMIVNDR
jgi:hypothetical protein